MRNHNYFCQRSFREERTCDGGDVGGSVSQQGSKVFPHGTGTNLDPALGILRICNHTVQDSSRGHATVDTAVNEDLLRQWRRIRESQHIPPTLTHLH